MRLIGFVSQAYMFIRLRCCYMRRRVGETPPPPPSAAASWGPGKGVRGGEGGDGTVFDYGLSFPHVNYYQCASGGRMTVVGWEGCGARLPLPSLACLGGGCVGDRGERRQLNVRFLKLLLKPETDRLSGVNVW